jgi:hypothetical protein
MDPDPGGPEFILSCWIRIELLKLHSYLTSSKHPQNVFFAFLMFLLGANHQFFTRYCKIVNSDKTIKDELHNFWQNVAFGA